MDGRPLLAGSASQKPGLPLVRDVDPHPLIAQIWRVLAATELLGHPLGPDDIRALGQTLRLARHVEGASTVEAIQRVLDRSCLAHVQINPEMRVKVARGPAIPALVRGGWRPFLVKVHNEAGTTSALRAGTVQVRSAGGTAEAPHAHRWLDLLTFDDPPMLPTLSGLAVEYRIVRLHAREAGRREASLAFDVGQGTQDLGFRNEVPILFDCRRGALTGAKGT